MTYATADRGDQECGLVVSWREPQQPRGRGAFMIAAVFLGALKKRLAFAKEEENSNSFIQIFHLQQPRYPDFRAGNIAS